MSSALLDVLIDAGLDGRLSWAEVAATIEILENYRHLADARYWSIYESLGRAA